MGIIFVIILYFIPTIIAMFRRHSNSLAIGAINLLLGWTVISWVSALVWSLTDNTLSKEEYWGK
jgi:uncharacterized membrane protein